MVRRVINLRAQADRAQRLTMQMKVFGDDAGIPRAAGSSDQARKQVREDAGKDDGSFQRCTLPK